MNTITYMKILIATGIYPPKIGGPAQYSKNIKESLEKRGYVVHVATYNIENYLPTGVRHLWFMVKILPHVFSSDLVLCMDTFSVGIPGVFLAKILGKKSIIRTGGDFLWEGYVEKNKKKVLLSKFYEQEKNNFLLKDKIIFRLTDWALSNSNKVVFSTEWQKNIFLSAYKISLENVMVIENYYGQKDQAEDSSTSVFIGSARHLFLKNMDVLKNVFSEIDNASLFLDKVPFPEFMEKIKKSYAVILVSLGDVSPNLILDAIRFNKPFICTKEVGIYDRIKDIGIFVDPLNKEEIKKAVLYLLDKENYMEQKEKINNFNFTHTWDQITDEFMEVYKSIK